MIDMKRNNLNIDSIHPKNGKKFSPNLHRFMKNKGAAFASVQLVYEDSEGVLWIGYCDDHFFTGARLVSVLCDYKSQTFAHIGKVQTLTEVSNFWERYVRDGRCAIDQSHSMYFVGNDKRWKIEKNTRACQWCGHHVQVQIEWQETIDKSAWIPA